MRRALILSLALHAGLLGAVALGSLRARSLPEPTAVAVELVAAPETGANQRSAAPPAATAPLPPREAASPKPAPRPEPEAVAAPPPQEPAPRSPTRTQAEPEPVRVAPPPPAPEPAARPEPPKEPPRPVERPRPIESKPVDTKLAEAEKKPPAKLDPPRPAPRPEPPKPEPAKPEPARSDSARSEPAKPAPKVEPVKPEPKPAPPRPPAEAEDSFAALLKSVERLERRVRAEQTNPGQGRNEVRAPEARGTIARATEEGLSQSEIDAIRRQIERCWNVPVGVRGIETMQVRLRIALNRDGTVARVGIEDQARMAVDPAFRVVAESAQRAVLSCHLTLPPEKYELWREMVMTFYPGDALRG